MEYMYIRSPTTIDFDYCILCQKTGNGELMVPGEKGINKLKQAMMRRKKLRDSKNRDAIERLETIMDLSHETPLQWHRMCYSQFTQESKIQRLYKSLHTYW